MKVSTKVEYMHTSPIYFIHGTIKKTQMYQKIYTKFENRSKIHRQIEIQSYSGIPHSDEKQHVADEGNDADEFHKHEIEQKMPNTKHMAYDFL